ncbi:MAG: AEC family transporter [Sulfitobacter sp.]
MSLALSVLPLVLIISCGYLLAKSNVLPKADWKGIETLSFRVLIPAVLILTITRTDLSLGRFSGVMIALLITWAGLAVLGMSLRLLPKKKLSNPAFTTIFQVGTRWNAFVALAAAEQFIGAQGLGVMAVAIALLIPAINVSCIIVMSAFGPNSTSLTGILMIVAKNPLVQACVVGLLIYFSGVTLPDPIIETLDMIGRGALAVGLLAVGAGISLRRLTRWDWKVAVGVALRPVIAPVIFAMLAMLLDLNAAQTLAGVLVFAAPAASNGYIIAKQMGGDADLYADILTWQTLLCLIVLPIWAYALIG